jgi:hypothetical protein
MRFAVEKLKQGNYGEALNWVLWEIRDAGNHYEQTESEKINQQHWQQWERKAVKSLPVGAEPERLRS